MTKEGNCTVCGKAPKTDERPNGCDMKCEVPEEVSIEEEAPVEEAPVEEALVEEAEEEVEEEAEEVLNDESLEAYLEELPVKELKKLCEEADLSVKGKKAALVARLLE